MIDRSLLAMRKCTVGAENLPWFPASSDLSCIYLLQVYSLLKGFDIAIWTRDSSGNCRCKVFATGPLYGRPPSIDPDSLVISDDESIPRRERLLQALDALPRSNRDTLQIIANAASPLIDREFETSLADFERILDLARSIQGGSSPLLGSENGVRIVVCTPAFFFDANTWSGVGEPQATWGVINQLLKSAQIQDLPGTEIDVPF